MLIQGKFLSYGDDLSEVLEIRQKVFGVEMGYTKNHMMDDIDQLAMHVIVYEDNPEWKDNQASKKAVATGRIYFDGVTCEISQVAVLKDYRRKKYGDFTVRMLLNKAFTSGVNRVTLTSPCDIVDFFKAIGFKVAGDSNIERSLVQYPMAIQSNEVITQCSR